MYGLKKLFVMVACVLAGLFLHDYAGTVGSMTFKEIFLTIIQNMRDGLFVLIVVLVLAQVFIIKQLNRISSNVADIGFTQESFIERFREWKKANPRRAKQ